MPLSGPILGLCGQVLQFSSNRQCISAVRKLLIPATSQGSNPPLLFGSLSTEAARTSLADTTKSRDDENVQNPAFHPKASIDNDNENGGKSRKKKTKHEEIEDCFQRLDLSFQNTAEAFRSKTNSELLRGIMVLKLCGIRAVAERNQQLMKVAKRVLGENLFRKCMKMSFYGHFVAGESIEEITPKTKKMLTYGVKSILDYSVEQDLSEEQIQKAAVAPAALEGMTPIVEDQRYKPHVEFFDRRAGVISARTYFYEGEAQCDLNAQTIMRSVEVTAATTGGTGFTAIKLTALGRPQFLMQLSEVIWQMQHFYKILTGSSWENLVLAKLTHAQLLAKLKEFGVGVDRAEVKDWFSKADFDQDGFIDMYDWGSIVEHEFKLSKLFRVLNLKTGKMENFLARLSAEEELQFTNMMDRLTRIIELAASRGVRVMIDAEQTYFQPAINRLTLELMRKFNKEIPIVFNTYQAYLKQCSNDLNIALHMARREDFCFSAKLVRGAYVEQERKRAAKVGYEDPINPSYEATTEMYETVLRTILKEVNERSPGKVCVMCATHNEDTVRSAVKLMRENGLGPSHKVVCFGQLYGMCDQISYMLGQAGYSVYKYVPFGPVNEVLPYLSRRAQENSTLLGKSNKEQSMMGRELFRRIRNLQFSYVPKPSEPVPQMTNFEN